MKTYQQAIEWIASEMNAGGFGRCVQLHNGASDSLDVAIVMASEVYDRPIATVEADARAARAHERPSSKHKTAVSGWPFNKTINVNKVDDAGAETTVLTFGMEAAEHLAAQLVATLHKMRDHQEGDG